MSNPCGTAISLTAARTIVVRAPAHARSSDFPPMTVAVLDAAGRLVAVAGEDVSSLLRERIARASAAGALNMGVGSGSLATRAEARPAFINSAVALAAGELVPVAGGVLVRDEACGLRGIARWAAGRPRNLIQPSRLMSKQTPMSRIFEDRPNRIRRQGSTHPSTNGCAAVSGPGSMSTGSRPITSCAAAWSPSWK